MRRRGFRSSKGTLKLRLASYEFEVLSDLLGQLEELVRPVEQKGPVDPIAAAVGIAATAETPQDPALLRLLPDAYLDDQASADDFRRFTEIDLRQQKAANATLAKQSLGRVADGVLEVDSAEGRAWLLALTDLRLVLAVRFGIADAAAHEDHDPPAVYDWLTWLQSTLVDALMP